MSYREPPPSDVEPVEVVMPARWYLGAHGDPIARFGPESPVLVLHPDGSVTWRTQETAA